MAPTVTVSDNFQPRTASASPERIGGLPDAINDTSAVSTLQFRLRYTEPMDPTSAPVFTNSGGAVTQAFTWENGAVTGVMTLTIPAGGDITGPFTIRGGKDLAGNTLATGDFTGVLGGRRDLLLNGSFEDAAGACTLTSWNPTGSPVPTSVPNNNSPASGKCGAILGSPVGSTPVTGLVKLSQDVTLPDITNGLGWSYEWHLDYRTEYQTTGNAAAVTQRCRFTDTSDVLVAGIFSATSSTSGGYIGTGGNLGAGQTIRLQCEVNNATTDSANAAVFIDNASIALVKPNSF
jgi:hypothetical protein